jgi:hypothetical protein
MRFSRTAIAIGIASLSLAGTASPALAKGGGDGGGDINNTVVTFISPDAPAPFTGGSSGSGKDRTVKNCRAVGIDPLTGSTIMSCTKGGV